MFLSVLLYSVYVLCAKAFSTGARGRGVGIMDFEPGSLKRVHVVQFRAGDVEDAFGVDDDFGIFTDDQDITGGGFVLQVYFVLQAGASAADDGYPQNTIRASLAFEQGMDFVRGILSHADNAFITDAVVQSRLFRRGGCGWCRHCC